MKLATVLRSVKLYTPARKVADGCLFVAKKMKLLVYNRKLRKHINTHPSGKSKRILIVMKGGGIGNSIEATPLVQAVREFWPSSEITLLTSTGDLFAGWCVIDRICSLDDDIEGQSYDHTFLTYSCHWGTASCLSVCNPGTVHRPRQYFDEVCLKPERQYNLDMLRRLGFKKHTPPLYVSLKQTQQLPESDKTRICILPGGKAEPRWQCKRWPYFKQIAEQLIQKYLNCEIYIIGTKDDIVDENLLALDGVVDMRGALSLAETAWTLKNSQLVIGNDCGPMHIADAVGARGVAIFGPTCRIKNGPCNKIIPVSLDLTCVPCQYKGPITCQSPDCMTKLTPNIVLEQIEVIFKDLGLDSNIRK